MNNSIEPSSSISVGDTFVEHIRKDKALWVITEVVSPVEFFAEHVKTKILNWSSGIQYPLFDAHFKMKTFGPRYHFKFDFCWWKAQYEKDYHDNVVISFGEKFGYYDTEGEVDDR